MELVAAFFSLGVLGTIGFWIAWSLVNGLVAEAKGRSFAKLFLASLIFSPMIGYFYILAVPSLHRRG